MISPDRRKAINMKKTNRQTKPEAWLILFPIVWLIQLVAEVLVIAAVWKLDMLPLPYFVLILVLMLLMWGLTGCLMFLKKKKKQKHVRPDYTRQVIGGVLAMAAAIACVFLWHAVSKLHQTMTAVTAPAEISSNIGVYVLKDDPAQVLADAGEYSFGITDSYDAENTQKAIESMQEMLGREIETVNYDSVLDMIDALYGQEIGAIILNEAYTGILEDIEEYADFSDRTRMLHEVLVTEEREAPVSDDGTSSGTESEGIESGLISSTPFIVYLSGSDTRNKTLTTSRSDVNILAVVNPETKQVLLVNTPRDYYVPNPAGNGALDKLTHCGIYGIQCSVQALSDLYDEQIDCYAQINFTGFETLIDAIGGITVYSDVSYTTRHGNVAIQKGYNELNGSEALGFARERYALAAGDIDRGRNQMKVITAVIEKLSVGTMVTNYSGILDSLQNMFVTDMPSETISQLVKMQLSDMAKWNVVSYTVVGSNGSEKTYSMPNTKLYVMIPDEGIVAYAKSLIDRVVAGEILSSEDVKAGR